MKPLFVFLLFIMSAQLSAQEPEQPKTILFQGYLLAEDSIPVENAYLINYRSMKVVATDSTGYFRTWAEEGDSLMINHLSLQPKVVFANKRSKNENRFRVDYRIYVIKPVVTNEYALQLKYFEKNMKLMYAQLENLGYQPNVSRSLRMSPYNPDEMDPGLTIRLGDIIGLFKKKR
ncbi:MAG: hypothetical protein ACK5JD_02430 [Mangrovibacterium sp.]